MGEWRNKIMAIGGKVASVLRSPWAVLAGCLAGGALAVYAPNSVRQIAFIGDGYLALLKMCVFPIMLSAIISGIGRIFAAQDAKEYMRKLLLVFLGFLVLSCLAGIGSGLLIQPLISDDQDSRSRIGSIIMEGGAGQSSASVGGVIREIDTNVPPVKTQTPGLSSFFVDIIPKNVFSALSDDHALQALFFFIVFGLSLKFVSRHDCEVVVALFDTIFQAFQKIIKLIILFLPLGLCSLLANQFLGMDKQILSALAGFLVMTYAASALVLLVSALVIWKKARVNPWRQISILREPILIALSTRSSFPTLPSALSCLIDDLKFNPERTSLSVSLGHTLCKYGKTMMFCLGGVYSMYLYGYDFTAYALIVIFISSILTGMAASGAPSLISRTMIAMVLSPIGVPSDVIIAIMLAVDPLTDPVITLVSTYPNYAVAAMIAAPVAGEAPELKTDADSAAPAV